MRLLPKEREWKQKSAKLTKSQAMTCTYFEHVMSKFVELLKVCLNGCNMAMLYCINNIQYCQVHLNIVGLTVLNNIASV